MDNQTREENRKQRRAGRMDRRYRDSDYARDGRFDYSENRRPDDLQGGDWRLGQSHYMGGSLDQGRLDYGRGRDYGDRRFESYGYQQDQAERERDRARERAREWDSRNYAEPGEMGFGSSPEYGPDSEWAGGWRGSDHSWNERSYFDRGKRQSAADNRGVWESLKSFFGKGPKGYKRSDERIREDACEALARHPGVDASDIEVAVDNSVVVLKGTVPNRWMKRQAEDVIDDVSGVDDVRNEIQMRRETPDSGEPVKPVGKGSAKNTLI